MTDLTMIIERTAVVLSRGQRRVNFETRAQASAALLSVRQELKQVKYPTAAIAVALLEKAKAVETVPCADCQKPVWYCETDEEHYHTDPNHSCFLSNGKAPQVTQ